MVKNLEKSGKISKNHKKKKKNLRRKKIWPKKKEKNAFLLVLPNEEIWLQPELSTPPRFRIQGGSPERYEQKEGRSTEILVSNIGLQSYTGPVQSYLEEIQS